jgi:hypothetical protein
MAVPDQKGQLALRKLVVRGTKVRPEHREFLRRRIELFLLDGYGEAASWIQSFLLDVVLLCGLYGLALLPSTQ